MSAAAVERRSRPARRRVGVNLLWLVPGVVGGSEEYATRLLAAWADEGPDDLELVLFALAPFVRAHPDLAARFEVRTLGVDGRNKVLRVAAESTWLAVAARRAGVELVHHLGGRMPAVRTTPGVVTVHDLQPLDLAANFSVVKRRFLAWSLPRSLRRARHVMTVSEFVRAGCIARGADPARTSVVSAPAPAPRAVGPEPPADLPDDLRVLAGATAGSRPWFVYPGITYHHKNHVTLVRAVAVLRRRGVEARLVLPGGRGGAEPALQAAVDELGVRDLVVRPGRVSPPVLDWLVANAAALAFASCYEGFGLPAVEAMALGCPVVAADVPALREVVGDAGVLVDPTDPDAWADALAARLRDEPPRAETAARGRARLGAWAGPEMVRRLAAAYRAALP